MNGLLVAIELGLRKLQEDASRLLQEQHGEGRCPDISRDGGRGVTFGESYLDNGLALAKVEMRGASWDVLDYGDAIASQPDGPMGDLCGAAVSESNQRLSIRVAAGAIHRSMDQNDIATRRNPSDVMGNPSSWDANNTFNRWDARCNSDLSRTTTL